MSDKGATLVLGLGVAGRAVLEALVRRGLDVAAVDDRPGEAARVAANRLGVELLEAPEPGDWPDLLASVGEVAMAQREWNEALRYFLNAFELWNVFGSPLKTSVVGHLGQLRSLVDEAELKLAETEAVEAAKQALIEGDRGMATK